MEPFIKDKDVSFVSITGTGESIQLLGSIPAPAAIGRKAVIVVKVHKTVLTEENVQKEIAFVDIFKNPLECLSIVAQVRSSL